MTFWAAHADTASRRLQYVRTDDGWTWRRLAG
jgi:pyridoxamine 5'-phosphate oxidase